MSPFLSAVAHVSALLGPASSTDRNESPPSGVAWTSARWSRGADYIDLRVYDDGDRGLTARRGIDLRLVPSLDITAAVRDLSAWLNWPHPARSGYDANGSPVEGA